MKIEVTQNEKTNKYILKIGDEKILEDEKLSLLVDKIEDYLKMRFLKERPKGRFKQFVENFSN